MLSKESIGEVLGKRYPPTLLAEPFHEDNRGSVFCPKVVVNCFGGKEGGKRYGVP
jgi:hypothetical protein